MLTRWVVIVTVAQGLALVPGLAAPAGAAKVPSAGELANAQKKANAAAARLAKAQTNLAKAEEGIADLEARTTLTSTRLVSLEGQVRDLAVDQYVRGPVPLAWATQGDVSEAARRRTILRYVSLVRVDAVEGYRVARVDLETDRTELERRLAVQRTTVGRLRSEQARVTSELDRLASLQRARDAKLAADRRKAEAARRPPARGAPARSAGPVIGVPDVGRVLGSGAWICPVQGPRAFSNDWGQARSGGRSHQGNDIMAPRGTPVVASVAGSVKGHSSGLGGIAYYLKGDDGNTYYGAHLDRLTGASGRVDAGTVIGTVGSSGNASASAPHLHFEVHPGGGRAVNPFSLLSRFC